MYMGVDEKHFFWFFSILSGEKGPRIPGVKDSSVRIFWEHIDSLEDFSLVLP
jgi:hypothetical protein